MRYQIYEAKSVKYDAQQRDQTEKLNTIQIGSVHYHVGALFLWQDLLWHPIEMFTSIRTNISTDQLILLLFRRIILIEK